METISLNSPLPVATDGDAAALRLQALLDSQPWGIVTFASDGGVVGASARAVALFEKPIVAGTTLEQLFGNSAIGGAEMSVTLEQGCELAIGDRWLWLKLSPAGDLGFSLAMVDITPLRMKHDERVAGLRYLSHDLRSPQNSIVALTQLYESDRDAFDACGGVRQMGELARYALMLGENFMFSSMVGALQQRDFARFDMRATVRDLVPQLEIAAVYRNVALRLWLPDDAPVWIVGLRPFIARAFQNLVDNAIQASRPSTSIAVSLKVVEGYAELQIKDWAGGLPGLHQRGRIDSFDEMAKKSSKGFGIGLTLTARVARLHGGTLYAESNQGLGTTFVMRLPCLAYASGRQRVDETLMDGERQ